MSESTKDIVGGFFGIWILINAALLLCGVLDGAYENKSCKGPPLKVSYVLPGHLAGCWAGTPWGGSK